MIIILRISIQNLINDTDVLFHIDSAGKRYVSSLYIMYFVFNIKYEINQA